MAEDERKEETVYMAGSVDYVLLSAEYDHYLEAKVVRIGIDYGGQEVTATFDEFHLRELRLAIQRLERWIK